MAGIYIHIPFCKQACHYCDFHFSTSLKNKAAFLSALKKEIILRKNFFIENEKANEQTTINTIYLGGGTPSMLTITELMDILETVYNYFNVQREAEITLEANPDDLTPEKIKALRTTPVNRLSIGIQSFFEEDLKFMNRAHSALEAREAVVRAQDAGLENLSIDLIYGIQTLTHVNWEKNLRTALDLNVSHISAYCLTVEPQTALAKFIASGKVGNINEHQGSEQFEMMVKTMKSNGFQHYEISNFCKPGFHSKHNSNYWLKEKYLGLGPSAHSYNGIQRQWNVPNNAVYIQAVDQLEKGETVVRLFETEELNNNQRYNEYIMTSLRTMWGSDLHHIRNAFGNNFFVHCQAEAERYLNSKHLIQQDHKLFLTDAGKLFADRIASDLFII
jgi:oxygen-independent coproporphyrinogen-3 oxidase